ncbi:MAG: hypothetical protein J7L07_02765 [Candidatus Odinarchaeota archaeon]|nr:hypothetical protein [Candidatus Odinarchaeota archaeon]
MDEDRIMERRILLRRFFASDDVVLYRIARELGLNIASKYDEAYERSLKSGSYFYIPYNERDVLIEEIAREISDEKLIKFFNELKPRDVLGLGFRGKYYVYDESEGLKLGSAWEQVKQDVMEALDITGERGYAFLKAIIILHDMRKWSGDFYGASYSDILAVMRNILGKFVIPAPRDFVVLKSYKIYYKSGSRKYPSHSIPEEIIPAVKEALEEWKLKVTRKGDKNSPKDS